MKLASSTKIFLAVCPASPPTLGGRVTSQLLLLFPALRSFLSRAIVQTPCCPPLHAHVLGSATPHSPGGRSRDHRTCKGRSHPGRGPLCSGRPRRPGFTHNLSQGSNGIQVAVTARISQPREGIGRTTCWLGESADLGENAPQLKFQFCHFLGRRSRLLCTAVPVSARSWGGSYRVGGVRAQRGTRGRGLAHGRRQGRRPRSVSLAFTPSASARTLLRLFGTWSPLLLLTWNYDVRSDAAATSGAWLTLCAKVNEVKCAASWGAKVVYTGCQWFLSSHDTLPQADPPS